MKARRGWRRWRGWLWKLPLLFVLVSVAQVALLRFVVPPVSMFMVARQVDALVAGDVDFRLAQQWRGLAVISPQLPLAVVASEDQKFSTHHGFDFAAIQQARKHNKAMARRAERQAKPARRLRGASTISQQTAKNLFLWRGHGATRWLRKGLEVWYTMLIETLWPKARILEMYVNFAEFGDGVYGAQAAARRYFHKDARDLTASQAALLAAVLPNPKHYSAARPGPYVRRRARAVERQMRAIGGVGYLQTLDK